MSEFIEKWHKISEEKNSNICAGLDPAVFEMGRGEKGLPKGADKLKWSLGYLDAIYPHVSAIKSNIGYFGGIGEREILKEIVDYSHKLGLIVIADGKISDIGSTSDSYIYDYKKLGFDALTIAPYAGNIEELIAYCKKRLIGVFSIGIMSNPEYASEMNFKNSDGIPLWQDRVDRAVKAGVDGIVVGGTLKGDDENLQKFIEMTDSQDLLYLVPGIGNQGGDISEFLSSGIDPKKCIINSGREIMFPHGSNSSPEEQSEAARELKERVRSLHTYIGQE